MPTLDHLVLAVPDLDEACAAFAKTSGVTLDSGAGPPAPFRRGGVHPGRGTHNALVGLDGGAYLELVAPHPTEPYGPGGRWMGVDLAEAPTLTRWAVRDVDLGAFAKTLHDLDPGLGELALGERVTGDGRTLRWAMTAPRPGPTVEVLPFALDWAGSEAHPSDALVAHCRLVALRFEHPDPKLVRRAFGRLGLGYEIGAAPRAAIRARLRTPRGEVVL